MEDKNKNSVESLAAFLHSGGGDDAPVRTAAAAPAAVDTAAPEQRGFSPVGAEQRGDEPKRSAPEKAPLFTLPSLPRMASAKPEISDTAAERVPEETASGPGKPDASLAEARKPASTGSLSDVLFSLDSKKRERSAGYTGEAARESADDGYSVMPYDTGVYGEDGTAGGYGYDDGYDDGTNIYTEKPYYADAGRDNRYDNAATQMMELGAPLAADFVYDDETDEEKEERREIAALKVRYEKQRLRSRTFAFILLGVFLSVVIIGASAYISSYIVTFALDLTGIATNDFKIDVMIPENADTTLVAAILQDNNIIKSAKFFKFFSDFTHKRESFQPGTYTLSSTMSYSTLFSTLQNRSFDYKTVTIRIVEGMTASEIGKLLEENMVCRAEDFEQYYKNVQNTYDFELRVTEESAKFNQLEGYLFPDTYEFYAILDIPEIEYDSPEEERKAADEQRKNELEYAKKAADKMYRNFDDKITKRMYKKMGEMGLTLDEVITLASMIQKEAASTDDMYYVSSVFHNRLSNMQNFPQLQSDVTELYIENDIKPYIDSKSTRFSRLKNSYSSYVCSGIPAGPICNPGLDAINAALDPAMTEYYFFCANSETGDVYYASTQEEHEANLVLAGLVRGAAE